MRQTDQIIVDPSVLGRLRTLTRSVGERGISSAGAKSNFVVRPLHIAKSLAFRNLGVLEYWSDEYGVIGEKLPE
jgi:hypothetical protein